MESRSGDFEEVMVGGVMVGGRRRKTLLRS